MHTEGIHSCRMSLQSAATYTLGPSRPRLSPRQLERSSPRGSTALPPTEAAQWILAFDKPKAVHESGVTGFRLVRALRDTGVNLHSRSYIQDSQAGFWQAQEKRPRRRRAPGPAARGEKHRGGVLAGQGNRDGKEPLASLEGRTPRLACAKHRLTHLLITHDRVRNERNPKGKRRAAWTQAHWE